MSVPVQSYSNHAKFVPAFHYVGLPLAFLLLVASTLHLFMAPSVEMAMDFVFALVLNIALFYARVFALAAQDRVIRLEERMRMERLFEGDLKARIGDFTTEQLIGLRFASDAELPGLAQRVLDEKIANRKTIKMAVKDWRADHQRV
jgi:hypothetical protein